MVQIFPTIQPEKEPSSLTQSGKILQQLKKAKGRGVENYKLASYNLGYRSRITELRQDGYNIYCERQKINGRSTGIWIYYLTEDEA